MAKTHKLDEAAWAEWLQARPKCIQELAAKFPPDRLYRLKPTGQRVTLYSYSEDGTVTVSISGDYNLISIGRNVFGINPNDLEECELPESNEVTGTWLE